MAGRSTPSALSPNRVWRRLVGLLGPTSQAAWQSLSALVFSAATSFIAGATLVAALGEFERYPGLTLMTAAAIGLRGNISGALGNRLSTAIHTGSFKVSLRPESTLGQNLAAAIALSAGMSVVLALVAKLAAVTLGVGRSAPFTTLAWVSIIGGLLASLIVTGATVALSAAAVRFEWDLDSLVAPTVSTLGDLVTIPCLWAAAVAFRRMGEPPASGWTVAVLAGLAVVVALRSRRPTIREIVGESVPLLLAAMVLSTLAGLVLTKRLDMFESVGALLVLLPAFVSSAGALGGILAARIATGLHLGTIDAERTPGLEARRAMSSIALLSLPVFVFNGIGAHVVAGITGEVSPGVGTMLATSVTAAVFAIAGSITVAYYGTVAAFRANIDPDSAATPIVTSSVDFIGTMSVVVVAVAFGLS